jgi:hypothetical protein
MAVETIAQLLSSRDQLVKERSGLSRDQIERHYLRTEMVEPLIGATIIGGTVLGDGGADPYMPVLFIEQNGKRYSLVISSDDEANDGGRIFVEGGHVVMTPDGFSANNFDR